MSLQHLVIFVALLATSVGAITTPSGPGRSPAAGRLARILGAGLAADEGYLYVFVEVDLAREFVAAHVAGPVARRLGETLASELTLCTPESGYFYVLVHSDLAREFLAEYSAARPAKEGERCASVTN